MILCFKIWILLMALRPAFSNLLISIQPQIALLFMNSAIKYIFNKIALHPNKLTTCMQIQVSEVMECLPFHHASEASFTWWSQISSRKRWTSSPLNSSETVEMSYSKSHKSLLLKTRDALTELKGRSRNCRRASGLWWREVIWGELHWFLVKFIAGGFLIEIEISIS